MKQNLSSWLIIFFLVFNLFTSMFISVDADTSALKPTIILVKDSSDYEKFGFKDLGVYYTEESLVSFDMPFIIPKSKYSSLSVNQMDKSILYSSKSFTDRNPHYKYQILASNKDYYVVNFHMSVDASDKSFSIDFVPKLFDGTNWYSYDEFAWWNSSWNYRKTLNVDASQIPNSLKNFPMLVYIEEDDDLYDEAQHDLDDIVFVSTDNNTVYNHEIDNYTINVNSVTAYIWVNMTYLSGSDNGTNSQLYMFYGNPSCNSQENIEDVWDSNYTGVYHCNSTTTTNLNDSTINDNHATLVGGISTSSHTHFGETLNLDGTNDYITFPDGCWIVNDSTEFGTHEVWVKPNHTDANYQLIQQRDNSGTLDQVYARLTNQGGYRYAGHNDGVEEWYVDSQDSGTRTTNWEYICHAMKENDVSLFVNGNISKSDTSCWMPSAPIGDKSYHGFGTDHDGNHDFNGSVDEIRISNIRRNDSWINATYNNMVNLSTFISFGDETSESGAVDKITNFKAATDSTTQISLSWTQSVTGNYTYIERNSVTNWIRGEGTLIYNATSTSTIDSNLSLSNVYYFGAWAFNESTHSFSAITTCNNNTGPINPTNIIADVSTNKINFTWSKGGRADNTVIMRKANDFPANLDDGTELYNGSASGYDDTTYTTTSYYKFFSYNTTVDISSSGVEVNWASLNITCYNASNNNIISLFYVTITNESGSEEYYNQSEDGENFALIDLDDLPTGNNVMIKVNATGYKDAIYYMDINPNNYYTLKAYLTYENNSEQYVLRVIDEKDEPLENVKVRIMREVGGEYENVSIVYTDVNGYVYAYLKPDVYYKVNLSKTNYHSATEDYYSDPDYYGIYYVREFKLNFIRPEIDITEPTQIITFNGTINSTGHITIWYKDINNNTIDTEIKIFETYNYSIVLNYTNSKTGIDDFVFSAPGFNTSRPHLVTLYLNHSDLDGTILLSFNIMPIYDTTPEQELEEYFTDVFGDFELGWVKTFLVFLPAIFFLIVFGANHVGLGIMSAGMYMGFVTFFMDIGETASYVMIGTLLISAGVIVILIKNMRRANI